jgi:hypothetical protein
VHCSKQVLSSQEVGHPSPSISRAEGGTQGGVKKVTDGPCASGGKSSSWSPSSRPYRARVMHPMANKCLRAHAGSKKRRRPLSTPGREKKPSPAHRNGSFTLAMPADASRRSCCASRTCARFSRLFACLLCLQGDAGDALLRSVQKGDVATVRSLLSRGAVTVDASDEVWLVWPWPVSGVPPVVSLSVASILCCVAFGLCWICVGCLAGRGVNE